MATQSADPAGRNFHRLAYHFLNALLLCERLALVKWFSAITHSILLLLLTLELVGPLFHIPELPRRGRIAVAIILLLTAMTVTYHHRRRRIRLERYVRVLNN